MKSNYKNNIVGLRKTAFEEFKKIAGAEKRDFVYNMAYRRLVPIFSTAPNEETAKDLKTIEDMTKLGHGGAAIEMGEMLFNWSRDNGYHHG